MMLHISKGIVLLVAIQHFMFLYLEMFLWTKPIGLKTFQITPEFARQSAVLAANQGLYNGFLASGLVWSLFYPVGVFSSHLQFFFLSCVLIAGLYGAKSVSRRIFFIQALPALVALILGYFSL